MECLVRQQQTPRRSGGSSPDLNESTQSHSPRYRNEPDNSQLVEHRRHRGLDGALDGGICRLPAVGSHGQLPLNGIPAWNDTGPVQDYGLGEEASAETTNNVEKLVWKSEKP